MSEVSDEFAPPDPCDHQAALIFAQDEIAAFAEGICITCKAPAQVVDGWSVCPCCGGSWQVTRDHLIARVPYYVEPRLSASSRGVGE